MKSFIFLLAITIAVYIRHTQTVEVPESNHVNNFLGQIKQKSINLNLPQIVLKKLIKISQSKQHNHQMMQKMQDYIQVNKLTLKDNNYMHKQFTNQHIQYNYQDNFLKNNVQQNIKNIPSIKTDGITAFIRLNSSDNFLNPKFDKIKIKKQKLNKSQRLLIPNNQDEQQNTIGAIPIKIRQNQIKIYQTLNDTKINPSVGIFNGSQQKQKQPSLSFKQISLNTENLLFPSNQNKKKNNNKIIHKPKDSIIDNHTKNNIKASLNKEILQKTNNVDQSNMAFQKLLKQNNSQNKQKSLKIEKKIKININDYHFIYKYPINKDYIPKVFDCFPYNGQVHLLTLKLQVMDSFVDYYVISEGTYSYTGVKKNMSFDIRLFPKYAHKILYIPLSRFPKIGQNLTNKDHWSNNHYHRNSAYLILNQFANQDDIIIVSDVDEILSKEGFAQYNPQLHPWATAELRAYYYYFNRMSIFDYNGQEQMPNFWLNGIRLTTFSVLKEKFKGQLIPLRRSTGCNVDVTSKIQKRKQITCDGYVLRLAGWHFSYVMSDKDLLKKMRSIADTDPNTFIDNYEAQRTVSPPPFAYLKDFQIQDAQLPIQLVNDVIKNKEKSLYAPFFINVVENQKCAEGEVQIETNGKKKKTRLVFNIRDPNSNDFRKQFKPLNCQKIENMVSGMQIQNRSDSNIAGSLFETKIKDLSKIQNSMLEKKKSKFPQQQKEISTYRALQRSKSQTENQEISTKQTQKSEWKYQQLIIVILIALLIYFLGRNVQNGQQRLSIGDKLKQFQGDEQDYSQIIINLSSNRKVEKI